ncbi:MAG: lysophospholipid acyltransferase family protein [Pseudomonadota bacterium]
MEDNSFKKEKGTRWWFRLALFALPRLVTLYFRVVDLTSRTIFLNTEYEDEVCKKERFSCACFHGTMVFPVYYCRRYPGVIMVSRSWDGELIDRCLKGWNYDTVRGSSSRLGKEALRELIEVQNKRRYCSGLAVDAPRGPSRQVKIGIVIAARDTETPIVPLVSWATRKIQFGSWDRMILPLPFCTIVMAFGKPTRVPKGLGPDDYERIRGEVEAEMLRASRQAEDKVGELLGKPVPESTS